MGSESGFVNRRVFNSGITKGFDALAAGAAFATVVFTALVAGVGLAVIQGTEGLSAVLAQHPDDADAMAVRGLGLCLEGKKDEARKILEPLQGGEGTAAKLAASLMEQMG